MWGRRTASNRLDLSSRQSLVGGENFRVSVCFACVVNSAFADMLPIRAESVRSGRPLRRRLITAVPVGRVRRADVQDLRGQSGSSSQDRAGSGVVRALHDN